MLLDTHLVDDHLLGALRRASGDRTFELREEPRPLNSSGSVLMIHPETSDPRWEREAVVRLVQGREHALREAIVAGHLSDNDYPTPRVLLTGETDDPLGGAWLACDLVAGDAVRIGSGRRPLQAVRLVQGLWQRPALLARLTARLHAIDAEPVQEQLAEHGAEFDWHGFLWERAGQVTVDGADKVIGWLERNEPAPSTPVVSHGDLHPGNVIVGPDGPEVIDWGLAAVAPAARDVACIMFALESTGSQAPPAALPVFTALGRQLSLRFLRLYRAMADHPLPAHELDWHRVVYSMNRLFWASQENSVNWAEVDDPMARRAERAAGVLERELPLHTRLISNVTGVNL